MSKSSRSNANNHSNQLNQNNPAYWSSRGLPAPTAPVVGTAPGEKKPAEPTNQSGQPTESAAKPQDK